MKWLRFIFLIFRRGTVFVKPVDFGLKRRELIISTGVPDAVPPVAFSGKGHPRLWSIPGFYAVMSAFSDFRHRRDMNRMYYISDRHRVVFVRILKAAGTSILGDFLGLIDSRLAGTSMSDEQVDALAYYFSKRSIPASAYDYDRFAVVRDPYQRIVSAYLDLFDLAADTFTYSAYWFGILDRNMSFKDFVSVISKIPTSLLGPHFCPQHLIVQESLRARIFRLEKDNDELTRFLGDLGIRLSHRNKQKEEYDYRSFYDKESFNIVKVMYIGDVERFDYTSEQDNLEKFLSN